MRPSVKWLGALATALGAIVALYQAIHKTPDVSVSGTNNVSIGSVTGGSQVNIGGTELKQHESRAFAEKAKAQFEVFGASLPSLNASKFCKAATVQLEKESLTAQQALSEGRNIAAAELYGVAANDAQRISSTISIYDSIRERVTKRIERERSEIARGHRRHSVQGKDAKASLAEAEKLVGNGELIEAFEVIDPEMAKFSKRTLDQTARMNSGCLPFAEYAKSFIAK